MSEINRIDLVSDDALNAPLIMAKNFDQLYASMVKVRDLGKGAENSVNSAKSTNDLKKSTEGLTTAQIELAKIQKATETATARGTSEYVAQKKIVDDLNKLNKDRAGISAQEAKNVDGKTASYNTLRAALEKNRKIYQDLDGEQQKNSKSGQELLRIINSQSTDMRKATLSMGIAKEEVGHYRENIEKAIGSLGRFNPELAETAEKSVGLATKVGSFLLSGPFAVIAAIGAVIGLAKKAVDSYMESTAEGAERGKVATAQWAAAVELLKDAWQAAGKSIFEALGLQKESSSGILSTIASYLGFYDIQAKLVQRTQDAINLAKTENEIRREEIKLTVELAEKNLEKDKAMFEARDKVRNSDLERLEFLRESTKVAKESRELQLKALAIETKATREAIALAGYKIKNDETSADLLKNKVFLETANFELVEKLAAQEAKVFDIEDKRYQGARRRQALEREIIDSIIKRDLDEQKARSAGNATFDTENIKRIQNNNARIISNQNFTLEEQLAANKENNDNLLIQNEVSRKNDIENARLAAIQRVELDGETAKKIFDNAKLSDQEKINLFIEAKNSAINENTQYNLEIQNIDFKYGNEKEKFLKESGDKQAKIIADNFNYFIELRKSFVDKDKNEVLNGLNEQFHAGTISFRTYSIQKLKLEQAATKENLENTIQELKDEQIAIRKSLADRVILTQEESDKLHAIWVRLSDAEIHLSNNVVAKDIINNQRRLAFFQGLLNEAGKLAGIINGIFQASSNAQIQQYQDQIQAVQSKADAEIKIEEEKNKKVEDTRSEVLLKKLIKDEQDSATRIGYQDTESANRVLNYEKELQALQKVTIKSDKIKEEAVKKELALNKKIADEKNAAAIRQHAAEVIQAGITFAQAILVALSGAPPPFNVALAAITAAVAGVQLAAVIAAPIPHFEIGTKNAPGGFAIVGEIGAEAIKEPGQPWKLSPSSSTMMDVAKGAEIIPHDQTMRMLAMSSLGAESSIDNGNKALYGEIRRMRKDLDSNTSRTVKAIQKSGGNLYAQGSLIYKAVEAEDGSKKHIRLKNFSS